MCTNVKQSMNPRTKEQIEKEYSCQAWTKRNFNSGLQLLENFMTVCKEESDKVRQSTKFETISYGPTKLECFDIYSTDATKNDAPIFIFVHGGYWQMDIISKETSAYCVNPLLKAGYRVIVMDYDYCPNITLPKLIEQFTNGCKFILNYIIEQFKTSFITFAGHSAGAHLILVMLKNLYDLPTSSIKSKYLTLIQNIYLISGIYDLSEVRFTQQNLNNLLSINDENVAVLSPLTYDFSFLKCNALLNIQIFVGADESPIFIKQAEILSKLILNNKFHLLQNYDHFDIADKLCENDYQITASIINDIKK